MAGAGKEGMEVLEEHSVDALWMGKGPFQAAEAAAERRRRG